MKNYQQSLTEPVITDVSYFSQKNHQQLKNNVFCQFNNSSTLLCTSLKCTKPAFICDLQDCQCRKQHQICYELRLQSFLKNIQKKQVFVDSLETCINDEVQEIIDLLSTYRDEIIVKIKKDFELFGLSQNEKEFMKQIKDGKFYNVTGSKIWQMIYSEKERQKITKMVEQTCKSLRTKFEKSKKSFEETIKNTKTIIQYLESSVDKFLMETEKCKNSTGDTLKEKFEIHQSKIMNSSGEFKVIESFFAPRILKSAKLLYRASQNNFLIKKFHEKCDGVRHTLTLVETQFGKKIGGYTPIKWSSPAFADYATDEQMKSFIFSLTEGDKFELKNKDNAVYHYSIYGPTFGGHDLHINDKANTNNSSYGNINIAYKNQKYLFGNKKSFLRFNGVESSYFKVKQWQVWKVEFQ